MTDGSLVRTLTSRPARFVALLTVLMLPWPGLGPTYARAVGAIARTATSGANPSVTLRFTVPDAGGPAGGSWRLDVFAEDTVTGQYVQTALDLRRGGYIASAVFVALALATRTRPRKKLILLACGVSVLQLLPLLPLLSFFSGKLPVRVFDLGAAANVLIEIAYHTLVAPPGMAYAVPALLWLLLVWLLDPTCLPLAMRRPEHEPKHV